MSGLHDLVSGGADCSTSNAMAGFVKHLQKDRSLEQDQIHPMEQGALVGKQAFRSSIKNGKQPIHATDDFHIAEPHPMAHPSGADAFDFHHVHHALQNIPDLPPSTVGPQFTGSDRSLANGNWANDFVVQHPPSVGPAQPHFDATHGEFERIFDAHQRAMPTSGPTQPVTAVDPSLAHMPSHWPNQFSQVHPFPLTGSPAMAYSAHAPIPTVTATMPGAPVEKLDPKLLSAFDQAFEEAEQNLRSQTANNEVSTQPGESAEATQRGNENVEDRDALAQAAADLLDSVNLDNNPKFKNSQFMSLMQQLRNKEATIDGSDIVHQKNDEERGKGLTEDQPQPSATSSTVPQATWVDEFEKRMNERIAEDQATNAGTAGPQEFVQGMEKHWAEELENLGDEIPEIVRADWAKEFGDGSTYQEMEKAFQNSNRLDDWVNQYRKNIAHLADSPVDQEWENMSKNWQDHALASGGIGYKADENEFREYTFQSNNSFLQQNPLTDEQIDRLELGEAIMALEARVQHDPQDAQAWYKLGVRQQENEQDIQAIASLRKALEVDPLLHNAWIDLAVSYTNENCRPNAYEALESWISHHPKYQNLRPSTTASGETNVAADPHQLHRQVEDLFLQAARLNTEVDHTVDADVQIALGVLFHSTEDYDKATDCFQTALALRPEEYMLWNKLGATLANARQPQKAMDAYFTALELNPSYVRARYNLAISSINLGLHQEAAEHLLGALALQQRNADMATAQLDSKGKQAEALPSSGSRISSNLWNTLRMTMQILDHSDLVEACDNRNLDMFQGRFVF
ncbi:hypothetical protein IWQ62_002721 [Dispira parvispora]|uniref:Peroxisomal targeting signal receptor n=1 Tax=Dispira parvispora TaxID=1520584 RepID=A0A9W8APW1_9FUNG|nr:hypothetical protein IWQ62_002721 [Dispira parvispora]